jgi:8-amino-7-oxononanoate synthase
MKLLAQLESQLAALDAHSLRRVLRVTGSPCAPQQTVDGRPMLAFCSNDYLGLAAHPALIEALREGASRYGVGSGASHLISGHSIAHQQLEEKLAAFMAPHLEAPRALFFGSGYMANLSILSVLANGGAVADNTPASQAEIFSEALNHASIIDGARLSRAAVKVYPHKDCAALAHLLAASSANTKIVVTDSVFSMDGDLAPLPELLALCEQHQAWLVVDDAHGFGILGQNGRGVLEHFNLRSPNLVYMGTLSKAAGVGGAFVAAHASVIEWLLQKARPYIYTTATAPALAHTLSACIDLIGGGEGRQRRAHLLNLVAQIKRDLRLQQWRLLPSNGAIQPIVIGSNQAALRSAATLYEAGIWVPAIRPPTVPPGTARLRVTLCAAHSTEQLTRLITALNQLEQESKNE